MTARADAKREQQEALVRSIAEQVDTLRTSDGWVAYVRFSRAFHRYSLNNTMLILSQCPTATRVAGFRKWQEFGRQVRHGEKSIKIFGYSLKRFTEVNAATGEETEGSRVWYPILSVFDVAQTDGDPIPDGGYSLPDGDYGAAVCDAVSAWLGSIGWTYRVDVEAGREAHSDFATREVVIGSHLSPAAAAGAALHEAGHVVLGTALDVAHQTGGRDYTAHRGLAETEAESVAYVLKSLAGLPADASSIPYIAGWSESDPAVVKQSAANVLRAVKILAEALGLDGVTESAATAAA